MPVYHSSYLWRPALRMPLLTPAGPETMAARLRLVIDEEYAPCPVGAHARHAFAHDSHAGRVSRPCSISVWILANVCCRPVLWCCRFQSVCREFSHMTRRPKQPAHHPSLRGGGSPWLSVTSSFPRHCDLDTIPIVLGPAAQIKLAYQTGLLLLWPACLARGPSDIGLSA